jgi:hypothetical protein
MHNRLIVLSLVLAAVAGCSSSSTTSAQLTYTDPPLNGPAWRLMKDPSSTPTQLVLNLVGSGVKTRGVGFNLKADPAVHFLPLDGGMPVHDTGVFQLTAIQPDTDVPAALGEPVYFAGGVMSGNILTVGIFQKDRNLEAKASGVPLLRIALAITPGTPPGPLALAVVKARIMPDDIGGPVNGPYDPNATLPPSVIAKSHLEPIEIAVGTLQAN